MQDLPDDLSLFEDSMEVHGIDWITVFAYFDESGIHRPATETIVAGYLFSKDGAKLFRKLFSEKIIHLLPVDKHGKRMFHARRCINGYDQFEKLTAPEREHIVDLMVEAIIKSATLGVVVGMEKGEYSKAVAHSPAIRKIAGDEYSICLLTCIENMAQWVESQKISGRIEYVFEAGCNNQEEANKILGRISKSEELKKRYHWHDYSFREKDPEIPQLFAPDLLAWEWQRAQFNSANPHLGEWRLTLKTLCPAIPHVPEYLTATAVGIRAMINGFYGLTGVSESESEPI